MSGRDETGFKLRGRKVNALLEHAVEKSSEASAITLHRVGDVVDRLVGEIAAKHRADPLELNGSTRPGRRLFHPTLKPRAKLLQLLVEVVAGEFLERGYPGCHGQRITAERAAW